MKPAPTGPGPRRAAAMAAATGLAWVLLSGPTQAQDRADIDRTQILGNRELPKVLTIVPWRKPLPGELGGRPAGSLLDEVLAPVDRDVFRRQVSYDAQLQSRRATSGAAASELPAAASAGAPRLPASTMPPR